MKSIVLGVCLLLPAWAQQARFGAVPASYFRGEPLRIANQIQLLVDDYAVEDRWKVTRETGAVLKHLRNPVLVQDKPWEEAVGGAQAMRPIGAPRQRTTGEQRHTIVGTDHDYGQKTEVDDCACG
jgi:hypothetical protein